MTAQERAERLKELLGEARVTAVAIAERAGVNYNTLRTVLSPSAVERFDETVRVEMAPALAMALWDLLDELQAVAEEIAQIGDSPDEP